MSPLTRTDVPHRVPGRRSLPVDNPAGFMAVPFHVFAHIFGAWREGQDVHNATSPFTHVEGTRYFHNGIAGYGIRPDGDLVFVHSAATGHGRWIVQHALDHGAETLDCFDGYLPTLYARHGFVEYAREANWTPGGPDVVFMATPDRLERIAQDRAVADGERFDREVAS